jgi:glycosyltransferase involved in cell wall biosynthesis
MRIAQVTATYPPYKAGTGNVCYHNSVELARLGHHVVVYTAAGSPTRLEDTEGISVRRLSPIIRFGNAPLLPGLLGLNDVDIIHLHLPFIFGAELVWGVSGLRKIPMVVTYHNDLIGRGLRRLLFDSYTFLSVGRVLSAARKIAVVSEDHALHCAQAPLFRKRWKDIVEIPNGVDTDWFHPLEAEPDIRRKYKIPDTASLLLFVAALDRAHHYKGLATLFQAVGGLSREDVRLLVVGEGELRETYRLQAEKMGIGRQTIFAGSVSDSDLPAYYRSADIFILPSHVLESFGMVLVEAMACGIPVIATNLPGVRSVVSDGEDGFLIPPMRADSLAEKILFMLDHSEIRKEMGIRGRKKAETKYAWRRIAPRLLRMYEDVLGLSESQGAT